MTRRIQKNYRAILGINGEAFTLGVCGVIQPTISALPNTSTLGISLQKYEEESASQISLNNDKI